MSERSYRQRLEADIARWQSEGVITPSVADSIRETMRPLPEGVTIAGVVAIVGGLLIAAAFLAFVAANWTEIARPARFAVLIAGVVIAFGTGTWFDRDGRVLIADLCVAVGSIVFGAAIALTGQMYHLGSDFAAGMLLLAIGALAAAMLTGSRGAFAVALIGACAWNHMRVLETQEVHLPFIAFWTVGAVLAVAWNAPVARHLLALAAISWLISIGLAFDDTRYAEPVFAVAVGFCLLIGAGLAFANTHDEKLQSFGLTLSHYGALALALVLAVLIALSNRHPTFNAPAPVLGGAVLAVILAFGAAIAGRRAGPVLAGFAIALGLVVVSGVARSIGTDDSWLHYALALIAMLCLVISGLLDDARPRVVAGWIGLGCVIAAITWAVHGSLLRRAVFLAAAGVVAVALATLLGRILRKERT